MSNAFTKLNTKVIQKTVENITKEQSLTPVPEGGSPFKQMLDSVAVGQEMAQNLGLTNTDLGLPGGQVKAIGGEGVQANFETFKIGLEKPDGIEKVVDFLSEVNDGQKKMQRMTNTILFSERKFSQQELMAIMAHVFHYAQLTELVVKAADQGVSSVKAVLNTNIQ